MQFLLISTSLSSADVSHILNTAPYNEASYVDTTTTSPPQPYVFSYTAGRYYGHVDRAHSEVSDGSGVVRGAFSYIDPRQQIRSVEYVADKDGFHPILSHPNVAPQQSEAVKLATLRHFKLYNKIAEQNANVSEKVFFSPLTRPFPWANKRLQKCLSMNIYVAGIFGCAARHCIGSQCKSTTSSSV